MSSYINSILDSSKAKCCITGWIELYENKYEAFLYTVEQQEGTLKTEHTAQELKKLYNH